jgi:hypothetical protein
MAWAEQLEINIKFSQRTGFQLKERRADGAIILNFLLSSNLWCVLNVVFFLLGFPRRLSFVPTFRNTLLHLHRWCKITPPTKLAHKIQTPGNHPKGRI